MSEHGYARAPEDRCQVCGWPLAATMEEGCVPGNCSMRPKPSPTYAEQLEHAAQVVRDLENKMQPVNEYVAKLEEAADLAIRGFRRWKRNLRRGGDRYEAEHGLTDLGQGISDLDTLLHPEAQL